MTPGIPKEHEGYISRAVAGQIAEMGPDVVRYHTLYDEIEEAREILVSLPGELLAATIATAAPRAHAALWGKIGRDYEVPALAVVQTLVGGEKPPSSFNKASTVYPIVVFKEGAFVRLVGSRGNLYPANLSDQPITGATFSVVAEGGKMSLFGVSQSDLWLAGAIPSASALLKAELIITRFATDPRSIAAVEEMQERTTEEILHAKDTTLHLCLGSKWVASCQMMVIDVAAVNKDAYGVAERVLRLAKLRRFILDQDQFGQLEEGARSLNRFCHWVRETAGISSASA